MKLAETLDNLISAISPAWGNRRKAQREMFEIQQLAAQRYKRSLSRDFEATSSVGGGAGSRTDGSWLSSGLSPNSELELNLETLRKRSRELDAEDGYYGGAIDTFVAQVVGLGIRPQARIVEIPDVLTQEAADKLNETLEKKFNELAEKIDWWEVQTLVCRHMAVDGDGIAVIDGDENHGDNLPPLSIRVIDPSRMENPPGKEADPRCRMGVEVDAKGRPIRYHIRSDTPGDNLPEKHDYQAIEAKDVCHAFVKKYAGQSRGQPIGHRVLQDHKDLGEFEEAELVSAKVAACFAVFIESPAPEVASLANATSTVDGKRIEKLYPGRIDYTSPGSKVHTAAPSRPGGGFVPFVANILKRISRGMAFPWELVTGDYSQTNYSSGRLSLIAGRQVFQSMQKILVEKLVRKVWREFVRQCVSLQLVDIDPRDFQEHESAFMAAAFIAPGWPWVDPEKEATAYQISMDSLQDNLTGVLAERGIDLEDHLRERKREMDLMAKYGIKNAADKALEAKSAEQSQAPEKDAEEPDQEKKAA